MSDAPQSGMRRIPFPLESYQHQSPPLSCKQLLNFYAEKAPSDARSEAALISTPGMSVYQTIGTGPIVTMSEQNPGSTYVVSGDHLWRIRYTIDGQLVEDMGYIGVPDSGVIPDYATMITIACSMTACVVCVPPRAYVCGHGPGDTLNQIGGDFPGAASVTWHDGYFVYTSYTNFDQFFISAINDPLDYDALDFASSEALPNVLRRVISFGGDLWLLGERGIEIWTDVGNADFPFRRRAGGVIPFTVASPRSVATGDNSVFWIGADDNVYRSVGYNAKRISTHAEEARIRTQPPSSTGHTGGYATQSAMFWMHDGHAFYALNFPHMTVVYDCSTGAWHDRESPGADGRWRAGSSAHYGDFVIWGDTLSNKVMFAASGLDTEDGVVVPRTVTMPPLWATTRRAFCSRLEIEMQVGDGATPAEVSLTWSDDGGFTWNGGPRTLSTGPVGDRRHRVYATRLGSFRQRVYRIQISRHATLYAVDADITPGSH